jgi:hypothetical protein
VTHGLEDDDPVPAYLTPGVIAKANGVTWKAAKLKLARHHLLEDDGPNRWHVRAAALSESLPGWYDRVFAHFERLRRRPPSHRPPPPGNAPARRW